jgi:starvation-inducible DNA-binding protein
MTDVSIRSLRPPASAEHLATLSEVPFVASQLLAADLQLVLVTLLELEQSARQANWTSVGPQCRSVHGQFDDIAAHVRADADAVATRMLALEAVPDGRTRTVCETTPLEPLTSCVVAASMAAAAIAERMLFAVNVIREIHDGVDAEDPASGDVLRAVLLDLERQRWLLTAQLRYVD